MRAIASRVLYVGLVSGVLLLGCGDDDGGGGGTPDASDNNIDAGDGVDAAVAELLRSGTLGIFEAEITNNLTGQNIDDLSGSVVSISWDDTTTGNIEALDLDNDGEPDSNVGGCAVKVFDKGASTEATETDEGTITVTGTGSGDFSCSFDTTTMEYGCISDDALATGTVAVASTVAGGVPAAGLATYTFVGGANFPATFVGMALTIPAGTFPNQAEANGTFPIVAVTANALTVVNPGLAGNTDTVATAGTYSTSLGEVANLVPGGFDTFLGGDGDPVVINGPTGASGAIVEQLSTLSVCGSTGCQFDPNGEGLVLDTNDSSKPHALPDYSGGAIDTTFTCVASSGGDGVCGDVDGGPLNAMIVSIESTDATTVGGIPLGDGSTTTKQDLLFPSTAEEHADIGVTIQCSFIGVTTGTVPQAVIQAMLDAHTTAGSTITRFKTQVIMASGVVAINADGQAETPLFVGHAVAGFTTP